LELVEDLQLQEYYLFLLHLYLQITITRVEKTVPSATSHQQVEEKADKSDKYQLLQVDLVAEAVQIITQAVSLGLLEMLEAIPRLKEMLVELETT
jgi:hypothetical protein